MAKPGRICASQVILLLPCIFGGFLIRISLLDSPQWKGGCSQQTAFVSIFLKLSSASNCHISCAFPRLAQHVGASQEAQQSPPVESLEMVLGAGGMLPPAGGQSRIPQRSPFPAPTGAQQQRTRWAERRGRQGGKEEEVWACTPVLGGCWRQHLLRMLLEEVEGWLG